MVFGSGMEATVYLFTTGSFNDWRNNSSYGTVSVWNDDDAVAPGQYLAIPKNLSGFTPATAVIPSMQGFMVGVIDRETPPASGKTVSFNYANLVKNTQQQRVRRAVPENQEYVYSVVTLNGGGQFDRLWLFTDEACTPAYDNGWDGRKFIAADKLQLYANQDEGDFQIHATNNVDGTYLAIRALDNDEFYTLHFRHNNMESKYAQLLLYDTQTKNVTDITADGSTYSFRAGNGDLSKRFRLITTPVEPDNDENTDISLHVEAQRIFVTNNSQEDGMARLYNLSGNLLYSFKLGASNVIAFPEVQKGLYLIEFVNESKKVNKKAMVR
ncbi:Minor fimbrium subunit Mfa5 [bioreactor metagenome]|uniref:Minor fimbrium subunit Mfa5 n=1 Tax=bioreactor metagenome TaxID=1076179 RepID=A0A645DXP8_9ZZZZ